MTPSLLIIEDNEDILLNLFEWFEGKGFSCDCARNGRVGLELLEKANYDCLVLDIMLPGMDGIELCLRLRQSGNNIPIIMLTAKDTVDDRVRGLENGADDYLVKPFSLKELEARIKAICRRGPGENPPLRFGPIELDRPGHRAYRDNVELRFSPAAFKILEMLLTEAPRLVPKERLEKLLWDGEAPIGSALRNHIHELRKVLDKPFDTALIETVPHLGWRLCLPEE